MSETEEENMRVIVCVSVCVNGMSNKGQYLYGFVIVVRSDKKIKKQLLSNVN